MFLQIKKDEELCGTTMENYDPTYENIILYL